LNEIEILLHQDSDFVNGLFNLRNTATPLIHLPYYLIVNRVHIVQFRERLVLAARMFCGMMGQKPSAS